MQDRLKVTCHRYNLVVVWRRVSTMHDEFLTRTSLLQPINIDGRCFIRTVVSDPLELITNFNAIYETGTGFQQLLFVSEIFFSITAIDRKKLAPNPLFVRQPTPSSRPDMIEMICFPFLSSCYYKEIQSIGICCCCEVKLSQIKR